MCERPTPPNMKFNITISGQNALSLLQGALQFWFNSPNACTIASFYNNYLKHQL